MITYSRILNVVSLNDLKDEAKPPDCSLERIKWENFHCNIHIHIKYSIYDNAPDNYIATGLNDLTSL